MRNNRIGWLMLVIIAAGCATSAPVTYYEPNASVLYPVLPPIKVAVFPTQNLSPTEIAGLKINEMLVTRLYLTGFMQILNPPDVEKFMFSENIRWSNTLTTDQLRKTKQLLDADMVVLSSVSEFSESPEPHISVSVRVISTLEKTTLFTATHSLSSSDREQVFEIGRIRTVSGLTKVIIDEIISQLESRLREQINIANIPRDKRASLFKNSKDYASGLWNDAYKTADAERKEVYEIQLRQQLELKEAALHQSFADDLDRQKRELDEAWAAKLEKELETQVTGKIKTLETRARDRDKKIKELEESNQRLRDELVELKRTSQNYHQLYSNLLLKLKLMEMKKTGDTKNER